MNPLPRPGDSPQQKGWSLVNLSTIPFWLAMILAPRSRFTAWLVKRVTPLYVALGATYVASLATGIATSDGRVDFGRLDSVSRAFQNPSSMLAGWTHYIAFDLFVGRWIWEQSLQQGRPARLSLLLTWWAGPAGLTTFLLRDRRA